MEAWDALKKSQKLSTKKELAQSFYFLKICDNNEGLNFFLVGGREGYEKFDVTQLPLHTFLQQVNLKFKRNVKCKILLKLIPLIQFFLR